MKPQRFFPRFFLLTTLLLTAFSAPVSVEEGVSAAPMRASALDVIISEVAWGGTAVNSSHEWIELYNTTSSVINLSGWTLVSNDSSPNIILSGAIPAYGYYLLESNADAPISNIAANQTYSGALNNTSEILTLRDNFSNTIDTANSGCSGCWYEGSGSPDYFSMERIGIVADSATAWVSNNGVVRNGLDALNNPLNGTPSKSQIDLSLTMVVSDPEPGLGGDTVFTITVTNSSPYVATNVLVKDVLPTNLNYVTDDSGGAYNSVTGFWAVGTLVNGASATLNITTAPVTSGLYKNQAEIWSFDQIDPDSIPGNNSTNEDDDDYKKIATLGTPSLSISASVNNSNPNVGTNVVLTVTVNNPSINPYPATNVDVAAFLAIDDLSYISYAATSGTYNGGTGVWSIGGLAIGASATINITAQVIDTNPAPFSATVSSNEFLDRIATVTFNNPLSGEAALSLNQTVNTTSTAGNAILHVVITNNGPDNASGVEVKDLLPTGLTFVSYSTSPGGTTYSSATGIWTVGNLFNGASATLNLTVRVSPSGTSTTNFAEVWEADQYDPDSIAGNGDQGENDDFSLEVLVSDLNLSESVDISGANAVFTIAVRNFGPDDATVVKVKTSLSNLASTYTVISYGSTQGTYSTSTGVWDVGSLPDGANATLTITTTTTGPLLVNWVEVSASDQVDPDSVPNNNSRTEDDDASAPSADLFLTHSVVSSNPDIGANVVFTVTVNNAGVAGTTNVQVRDLLPAGLTFVSYTTIPSGSTYSSSTGIWTVGTLAANTNKTLNITARVSANGVHTNLAEVWRSDESDPDSTPGNSSTTEDDDASAIVTSYRSIIINEVAWSGTTASANDEWIELYNPSSASINITGWTLKSAPTCGTAAGSLNITLSGTIASGGYFLLEREDNSTVSDVSADQIYPGPLNILSDTGEVLILCDGALFIDTANIQNGGTWPKGSASPNYGSMERKGTSAENDAGWVTNLGNPKNGKDANSGLINGTPRKVNSAGAAPVAATKVPPTATAAPIPPVGRPVINEFLARPGFDWNQDGRVDVFDEFIEVKNLGAADISLKGWKLDDDEGKGSAPFALPDVILKPGERLVFYGLQTNILLSDGGDTVRLLNPGNIVYDAYTYKIAKVEDASICRLPDADFFGTWFEDCTPTPNLINTRDGVVPSMPEEGFESPVCDLPDTLPADFLFAECRGYGAKIWNSYYWDRVGWQGDRYVPENMSKWESFVE